jgi:hypothetical protein
VNDVYLNGRPACCRGRRDCPYPDAHRRAGEDLDYARGLELLAGLMARVRPEPQGVPLARQAPELKARKRTITDLSLDPLS